MTVKRGRPTLAAQTLDAALAAEYNGTSPVRPRNEFERQAMRKTKGRKVDLMSPTQQAAQLAIHLIKTEGLLKQTAAQQAGATYGVNAANVRGYVRAILNGPQVELVDRKPAWFGSLPRITKPLHVNSAVALEVFEKRLFDEPDEQPGGKSTG